ncbi:MAG: tetratricopeptide repeat protein [Bacteroidota bacterium]
MEAKTEYEMALQNEQVQKIALTWNRLGFCYTNLKLYDQAITNYKKALDNNPAPQLGTVIYLRMAKAYGSLKDTKNSLENLSKAIEKGYSNTQDMDTAVEYTTARKDKRFKELKMVAAENAYPCKKDPRSRNFDFWVGDWDVYTTGTTKLIGRSLIEKASGECMILENWTSVGLTYEGKSINYVDPASGKWEQDWVGSDGTGQHVSKFYNGEYKDSAMRFSFERTLPNGIRLIGKFIFFNQGADQVRQFNEVSQDGGKTWVPQYDYTYIRRKKK